MKNKKLVSALLAFALTLSICPVSVAETKGEVKEPVLTVAATGSGADVATGSSVDPVGPASGQATDVVAGVVDRGHINAMAGKSVKLTYSGTITKPIFKAEDESLVSVEKVEISADYQSATATLKLLMEGETVIRVSDSGNECTCDVRVVPAMSKADFGMYTSDNFIDRCTKHKWQFGWSGEWKTSSKYGSTYRGIKIGRSLEDVERAYGTLNLKKCDKKKDPFLYEVKFNSGKKLVVKNYADLVYEKYRIRVYFTSKKTVFGFILVKNIGKIKKSWLKTKNGGSLKMV